MYKLKATALAVGLLGVVAAAHADVSANVALTSDYVFRGISQTDSTPAIQGGFDYTHKSGFYAGTWGSNVNYNTVAKGGLELDLYLGFANTLSSGIGYDVGVINYRYPARTSADSYDVSEAYGGLSYRWFSVKYSVGDNTLNANYLDLGASFDVGQGVSLALHAGQTEPDKGDNVNDYSIGISKGFGGYTFSLTGTSTDIKHPSDSAKSRVFVSVSKSL